MAVSWSVQTLDVLDSTQDFIKSDIDNLDEGACVQALVQNSGHGRHGRLWESPKGNLYFSFLLKPKFAASQFGQIALLVGLSVAYALRPYTDVTLKWPNDVLIEGHKVCGILIESVDQALVVGVGVNVGAAPIEGSVSLVKHKLDLHDLRDAILEEFATLYERWQLGAFNEIREEWLGCSFEIGTQMSVKIGDHKMSGSYQGIGRAGYLLLLCDKSNEMKTITSGDVFS